MKKLPVTLCSLVVPLTRALEELMESDLERKPFVIVEDRVTKRFVQFIRRYKPKTGELLFDVPALGVVLDPCGTPAAGAVLAANVLAQSFELPPNAELTITVDGDPAN